MKMFRWMTLGCLLLFAVSSCDLLNYDEIQEEQRLNGDTPPCQGDCK